MARLTQFEKQIEPRHIDFEEVEHNPWRERRSSDDLHRPGGDLRRRCEADVLAGAERCRRIEAGCEDIIEHVGSRRVVRDRADRQRRCMCLAHGAFELARFDERVERVVAVCDEQLSRAMLDTAFSTAGHVRSVKQKVPAPPGNGAENREERASPGG